MKKKTAGFTLLEILMVLVIFGAILGLGLFSITTLSTSTSLSEATADVIAILKETQNMAKNNTVPKIISQDDKLDSVYYYVVKFTNGSAPSYGDINRYLYARKDNQWNPATSIDSEIGIKSKLLGAEVNYGYTVPPAPECTYVMFEALSGDIKVSTSTNMNQDTVVILNSLNNSAIDYCEMTVILPTKNNVSKKIYVNAKAGNFGIVNEN